MFQPPTLTFFIGNYSTRVTRHNTNDGLSEISKMKYRNRIPEPGTTISSFADNLKKKKNECRPTDPIFI
jgi:hypothetical protein